MLVHLLCSRFAFATCDELTDARSRAVGAASVAAQRQAASAAASTSSASALLSSALSSIARSSELSPSAMLFLGSGSGGAVGSIGGIGAMTEDIRGQVLGRLTGEGGVLFLICIFFFFFA